MVNLWVDYSAGRPGGAALRSAGITGAIRYVSGGSAGKIITASEYADLTAHGIAVLLVFEIGVNDALGGYSQGAAHAQAALSTARAYGVPDSVGIAAACDEHLTAGQVPTAVDYVRGFADVLGVPRTGAYGFAEFIDTVHAAGHAGWYWKAGSAPTSAESGWVNFWQRNAGQTTQTINGVVCDLNEARIPYAGGVPDMELTDTVAVPALNADGEYTGDAKNVDGSTEQVSVADELRFTNAATWWLVGALKSVAAAVTNVQTTLADIESKLAAVESAQGSGAAGGELSGTATVNVSLAPAPRS